MSQLNRISYLFIFQGQIRSAGQWAGFLSPVKNTLPCESKVKVTYDNKRTNLIAFTRLRDCISKTNTLPLFSK